MCSLLISNIFLFVSCDNSKEQKNEQIPSVWTEISDGVYFENYLGKEKSIFRAPKADTDDSERIYIVKDKYIFRYSVCDNYIAYHWNSLSDENTENYPKRVIDTSTYYIETDYFTIYNLDDNTYSNFKTQKEFLNYCNQNNLLFEWTFTNCMDITKNASAIGIDKWEIYNFKSESLCGFVLKNGEVVYEGFISDIDIDENFLKFRLRVPDRSILEFNNLKFEDLDVNFEKVVSKKKISLLLLYEDIYFDKYINIDISTGTIETV